MTLTIDAPRPANTTTAAAYARGATKIYGSGDTEVVALDHVDVAFAAGQFTAIMGPSGSGKSTLMHCMAGLDRMTSGSAFIGDIDVASVSERQLTLMRRDRLGFIFQAFNLVPTLTALENITLPMDLAGTKADKKWLDHVVKTVGLSDRSTTVPASSPAANNNASPWPELWRAGPRSSSPTNPPATSTAPPAPRSWRSCATPCVSSARPSSW